MFSVTRIIGSSVRIGVRPGQVSISLSVSSSTIAS